MCRSEVQMQEGTIVNVRHDTQLVWDVWDTKRYKFWCPGCNSTGAWFDAMADALTEGEAHAKWWATTP